MSARHDVVDADPPWKDILEQYFRQFIAFFFPSIDPDIDWEQGYTFLDKEFQKITLDAEVGRKTVDKLVRVSLRNGAEVWALIHVEVQGSAESDFAERMYVYSYRLFERFHRHAVSLVVLTDARKRWKPECYRFAQWGYEIQLRFPVVKLLEYASCWEDLETSANPFALVVMTHLKSVETRKAPKDRLEWKLSLVKGLYHRGYDRQDIIRLFHFIDWMMTLPRELEVQFSESLARTEEGLNMPYVTSIERIGIEKGRLMGFEEGIEKGLQKGIEKGLQKGIEKGLQKGIREGLQKGIRTGIEKGELKNAREAVIEALRARFEKVPAPLTSVIRKIDDRSVLKTLLRKAVTVGSLEDFRGCLP
ncbi:hypothetical protein [Desulfatirhabdium butyrativorans]|uniref:hypothetical protein n=1 Tax=Desulfatirhabdium butyrativorans TaxID=340467 RepID=UPI0004102764|nr:hypothetical protein [Desulfatirhabdium butyrativorans]